MNRRMHIGPRLAIGLAVFLALACEPKPDPQRARLELLLSGAAGPDAVRATLSARQHEFLLAAAQKSPTLSDYIDLGVQMTDGDAPRVIARPMRGPYNGDYFAVLAKMNGKNLVPGRVDVRTYSDDYAIAVAYPPHAKPLLTTWVLKQKVWKVVAINLNVDPKTVDNMMKVTIR